MFVSEKKTWDDAQQHCVDMGGHLAHVQSEQENQVVNATLAGKISVKC